MLNGASDDASIQATEAWPSSTGAFPMTLMIETHELRRTFKVRGKGQDGEAVGAVALRVGAGEIFAFLGPNGAGKTTPLRMLATLLKPTSGAPTVAGADLA